MATKRKPVGTAVANERDAAFYFRCLMAADPHASERAALLSAGVPQRTVTELYPPDFVDIAPALRRHLARLPQSYLQQGEDADWSTIPGAIARNKVPLLMSDAQRRDFVQAHQANWPKANHLVNPDSALAALLGELKALTRPNSSYGRGTDIYNTIFSAWWLMTNRAIYNAKIQQLIDILMVWVAEHVLLDIHLMLSDAGESKVRKNV